MNHRTFDLDAAAPGVGPGVVAQAETRERDAIRRGRSELAEAFPEAINIPIRFRKAAIATTDADCPAGQHAWFGLKRIEVGGNGPAHPLIVMKPSGSILPADVAGSAAADGVTTAKAWGDTAGMKAAVVIGPDLPFRAVGGWTPAPFNGAGFIAGTDELAGGPTSPYWWSLPFPPGQLTDSSISKLIVDSSVAPAGFRVPRGGRIDAALVVHRDEFNAANASAGHLVGLVELDIVCALTRQTTSLE